VKGGPPERRPLRQTEHERRLAALEDFLAGYEAVGGEITDEEILAASRHARERAVVVRSTRAGGHGGRRG